MHAAMLLPAALAGAGVYLVARRFTSYPLWAALLSIVSPAFLVSGTQVMSDIPMLALWLWAMHCYFRGLEEEQESWCAAGGVLIGLAALTKYFGASAVPLLLVYTLLQPRRLWRFAWYLLIPVAMLLIYEFLCNRLYGLGLLVDAQRYAAEYRADHFVPLPVKVLTGLVFVGGCSMPLALLAPWLWGRNIANWALRVLLLLFALHILWPGITVLNPVYLLNLDDPGASKYTDVQVFPDWGQFLQWSIFFLAGLQVAALALNDFRRARDVQSAVLLCWVAGVLFFVCYMNHFVNGRVVLPVVPAAVFLALRQLERRHKDTIRPWEPRLGAPVAAGLLLSGAIACADYALANSARHAAQVIMNEPHTGTVWFSGHSGFQYYMEQLGGKAIAIRGKEVSIVRPNGDFAVLPSNNWNPLPLGRHLSGTNRKFVFRVLPWLATSQPLRHAGFYSDEAGKMPYVFGPVPFEEYLVVAVSPLRQDPSPRTQ
jgi:4-amino-4-deoxy-L-arabinose transferase-like glycosyltransferase